MPPNRSSCHKRQVHLSSMSFLKLIFSSNWITQNTPKLPSHIMDLRYFNVSSGGKYCFTMHSLHILLTLSSFNNSPFSIFGQRFIARKSTLRPMLVALDPCSFKYHDWTFGSFPKSSFIISD